MPSRKIEKNYFKTTKQLIDQIKTLEFFSYGRKRYYLIFNPQENSPVYISENIINHGYNQQDIYDFNLLHFEKHLFEDHSTIRFKFSTWKKKFFHHIGNPSSNKFKFIICGVKIKNKWNKVNSVVIKGKKLSVGKNDYYLYFLEIEEISNLYTGDLYWAQFITDTHSRIYFSSGTKKEAAHLLTPKELEVIKLITKNHSSIEIAAQLEVGVETIKKHRKNILGKTKVKDMTTLIQLLILCDMI